MQCYSGPNKKTMQISPQIGLVYSFYSQQSVFECSRKWPTFLPANFRTPLLHRRRCKMEFSEIHFEVLKVLFGTKVLTEDLKHRDLMLKSKVLCLYYGTVIYGTVVCSLWFISVFKSE